MQHICRLAHGKLHHTCHLKFTLDAPQEVGVFCRLMYRLCFTSVMCLLPADLLQIIIDCTLHLYSCTSTPMQGVGIFCRRTYGVHFSCAYAMPATIGGKLYIITLTYSEPRLQSITHLLIRCLRTCISCMCTHALPKHACFPARGGHLLS